MRLRLLFNRLDCQHNQWRFFCAVRTGSARSRFVEWFYLSSILRPRFELVSDAYRFSFTI